MRVSIHQPEFFPWAGFFNKLAASDRFVLFDNVSFKKNYFDNRCRIRINDAMHWLTVPVRTSGRLGQSIKDVEIDNDHPWGAKMWRTVAQSYARAPYLAEHASFLEDAFENRCWAHLSDLNVHIIRYVAAYLDLKAELVMGSSLDAEGSGSDIVLDTCKRAGASEYLSGRHGEEYLDRQAFSEAGIKLTFQDYSQPAYPQVQGAYLGPLSVLDALLNIGPKTRQIVLGEVA